MPARDRGWTVRGRSKRPSFTPRRVAISQAHRSRALRGAVGTGRRYGYPQDRPWTRLPASWLGPATEYAVYWYLTKHGVGPQRRKLREGRDFFYQRGLAAPGLFFRKPFTRGDFILPRYGRAVRGLVIDPISFFTHPSPWFDRRKRRILALAGWRVVFIEDYMLANNPRFVIEAALRGADLSHLGQGWA